MARRSKSEMIKTTLKKYGQDSLEKLMALADDEETAQKIRVDIYKWFAEMEFGKPVGKTKEENVSEEDVTLEGDLEKWSE